MRQKGELRLWNDDRGFGFIAPTDGGKDVFLHISALASRDRRPEIGQIVTYALSTNDQGRPRATNATLPGDRLPVPKKKRGGTGAVIIAGVFAWMFTPAGTGTIQSWIGEGKSFLGIGQRATIEWADPHGK